MNDSYNNGSMRRIIPLHRDEITEEITVERFETDVKTIRMESLISPDPDSLTQLLEKERVRKFQSWTYRQAKRAAAQCKARELHKKIRNFCLSVNPKSGTFGTATP